MTEASEADLLLRITELSDAAAARVLVAYAKRIRGPAPLASVLETFVTRLENRELPRLMAEATKTPALLRAERELAELICRQLAPLRGHSWNEEALRKARMMVGAILLRVFPRAPKNRVAAAVMLHVRIDGRSLVIVTADLLADFWKEPSHA